MKDDPHVQRILDSARTSLPGATDYVMQLEMTNVVEEFCRETNAWRDVSCITLQPCRTEYPIFSTDGNGEIYRLMWVENACPTDPKFTAQAWMDIPGILNISFTPTQKQDIKVTTALSPNELGRNQNFPGIPSWMWSQYAPILSAGLTGKMMAQPAKPYSSPQLATANLGKYRRGIAQTRMFLEHGHKYGGQRWAYPQAFAVRRRKY